MKTKLTHWDAFRDYMEQIYWEGILEDLKSDEIDFFWNEFVNA